MLISIINILFIMTSDEQFNNHLAELIRLTSIKGSKYKHTLKNSQVSCVVYKTINKKTIEFPVNNLKSDVSPAETLNQYFNQYMRSKLIEHYSVFSPLVDSISFQLVMELNNQQEIINFYYKTAFFTKKANTVVRILPNDEYSLDDSLNKKLLTLEKSKHKIVKNLFGITLDHDFVFDKHGVILIEMLSI